MTSLDIDSLLDTVQHNCDVANAKHAADATLCIYLLRMREYYRWHHGLSHEVSLDNGCVSEWVQCQEARWELLESQPYQTLEIGGECLDPRDSDSVNAHLLPNGFVYSAGLGRGGAQHFFLADLECSRTLDEGELHVAGVEHARDIGSPPAMSHGTRIFLRRQSMERMLWEQAAETSWHSGATAMSRSLATYGYAGNAARAIRNMTNDALMLAEHHERGEIRAGQIIGAEQWHDLLQRILGSRTEVLVRTVRDNLADALYTLPVLVNDFQPRVLHLYMSTLTPARISLQPTLVAAYKEWLQSSKLGLLERVVAVGVEHWEALARSLLDPDQHSQTGSGLSEFIQSHTL